MGSRLALIIANTDYVDPGLAELTSPGRDAQDFARVLRDPEISAFDEVNIVLNQPEYVVREAIGDFFSEKMPDDLLVLYFSGHGVRDELGALYLAVKNTIRSKLRATGIKSDYIRDAMDQSRSRRQVLILDCCNSGAFAQGTKAATGMSIGTASAFEGGYGRVILTASDATQYAWEGDAVTGEAGASLFTRFLVEGLEGEADLDGDGRITVDELYDYAYEKVKLATPKQSPSKFSTKQQGEIVLRQFKRIEDIKSVALPEQLVSEIENRYPEVRLTAVEQLAKLLNGKNLGLARSAREALEKIAAEDDSRRVSQAATQVLESFDQVQKKAEEERKAKEEAERLAFLKAEEERLAREKAEADRRAKEEAERLARAQAAREAAEREAMRLKAEREAAEKAAREAAEKAAREKAERELAEREAARLAAKRETARLAAERQAALIAERDAARLAQERKAQREAAQKAEREAVELAARRKAEREAKVGAPSAEQPASAKSRFLPIGIVSGVVVLAAIVVIVAVILRRTPAAPDIPAPNVPSEQPTAAVFVPQAPPVQLMAWLPYNAGGPEETITRKIVADYEAAYPFVNVTVVMVPPAEFENRYKIDTAAGRGPDLFMGGNDTLGDHVRAGLIAPIDDLVSGKLDAYSRLAVNGVTLDGKIYGVPGMTEAVGLYYNKSNIPIPPATTDDLLNLVKSGKQLGLVNGGSQYFLWGFWSAFGGTIMDDTGKCVAGRGPGVVDAFQYIKDLWDAGANIWAYSDVISAFKQGKLDMVADGPWALPDFKQALGDMLGVAPLPAGPKGPSKSLTGIAAWYINPNSPNKQAAAAFAFYAFNKDNLIRYVNGTGRPPARTDVILSDPLVSTFGDIAAGGLLRPQNPEIDSYWGPFGVAVNAITIDGTASPADAVKTACQNMNSANGK